MGAYILIPDGETDNKSDNSVNYMVISAEGYVKVTNAKNF